MMRTAVVALMLGSVSVQASQCLNGPCMPGNEFCAAPFTNAPGFHLMDQVRGS